MLMDTSEVFNSRPTSLLYGARIYLYLTFFPDNTKKILTRFDLSVSPLQLASRLNFCAKLGINFTYEWHLTISNVAEARACEMGTTLVQQNLV